MKHFILVVLTLICLTFSCSAEVFHAPSSKTAPTDSTTTHVYEIKGVQYPLYKSPRGRYYIWRKSKKTGKMYKQYIPKEIQQVIEKCNKLANENINI